MAATMAGSAAATTTGPIPASIARRQTWTIIASPWMSASGLSGRRMDASRAGTRISGFLGRLDMDLVGTASGLRRIVAASRLLAYGARGP